MAIYHSVGKLKECKFKSEAAFEKEVFEKHKIFFGENTIYIDAKKKMETKIGNVIPDGFLFDLQDINNPEFYIVEVELAEHSFYDHIFPQITKFIGFINSQNYASLITKIYKEIEDDATLQNEFEKLGVIKEKYKFILDTMLNSSNILLVIDDEKNEITEMNSVYQEWNRKVKQICIKKYKKDTEEIYDITPEFKDIEDSYINEDAEQTTKNEDFHLANTSDNVKNIYNEIKKQMITYNSSLIFNPQKYYISIKSEKNFAYLKFRKQKIKLIINLPYNQVTSIINNNDIQNLSDSVQKYYFGKANSSCAIIINDVNNISEVIELLKKQI